jgi:hypothetical protein
MDRPISDAWFHRIKAATRDLIDLCGGIERAARLCGMSPSVMGRYRNGADALIITIPVVMALELECGQPVLTAAMAGMHGRALSEPDGAAESTAHVFALNADVLRRASDLMAVSAASASDGRCTPAEAEQMDRAAADLENEIRPLRQGLAAAKAAQLKVVR